MSLRQQLLDLLADGRFHSGQALGARLGVTRTAIWKALRGFTDMGLEVEAVPGRGYRLSHPVELLDAEAIGAYLSAPAQRLLAGIEIHPALDSTNRYLMERAAAGAPSGLVCLAEHQRAGRGRRGRPWVSPFGGNVYLSIAWRFAADPASLAGLSVALGVATARALRGFGVEAPGLKWPNDIVVGGAKLAGILLEMSGESAGMWQVVCGLGVNVHMPRAAGGAIDQPWTDLRRVLGTPVIARNRLVALLLSELLPALDAFPDAGLARYIEEWNTLDVMRGKAVVLHAGNRRIEGHARGIASDGALLVDCAGELRRFTYGDVSLRKQAGLALP